MNKISIFLIFVFCATSTESNSQANLQVDGKAVVDGHVEINQPGFVIPLKVQTVEFGLNLESRFGNLWDIYGISDNNPNSENHQLQIYYNNEFKGQFSGVSGNYIPAGTPLQTTLEGEKSKLNSVLPSLLNLNTYLTSPSDGKSKFSSLYLDVNQVQKFFPSIINVTLDRKFNTIKSIDYSKVGVLNIEAIKELHEIISNQELLLNDLKSKFDLLFDRLKVLENQN